MFRNYISIKNQYPFHIEFMTNPTKIDQLLFQYSQKNMDMFLILVVLKIFLQVSIRCQQMQRENQNNICQNNWVSEQWQKQFIRLKILDTTDWLLISIVILLLLSEGIRIYWFTGYWSLSFQVRLLMIKKWKRNVSIAAKEKEQPWNVNVLEININKLNF